jgi:ribosomal protein S18 acetylase RimI-like enzyme
VSLTIEPMMPEDYKTVLRLWQNSLGIGLSAADSQQGIQQYLERNPGLSFVAREDGVLVGAVLCGHDGRRGFLHHLAVESSQRCKGIGRKLVDACMMALKTQLIDKCHIFVFMDNTDGLAFWEAQGWKKRSNLTLLSRDTTANQN